MKQPKPDTWERRKAAETKAWHGSQMVLWLGRQDSAFATCSTWMEEENLDFQTDGVEGLSKAVHIGKHWKAVEPFFPQRPIYCCWSGTIWYFLSCPTGIHWEGLLKTQEFSSFAWEFIFPVPPLPSSCSEFAYWQVNALQIMVVTGLKVESTHPGAAWARWKSLTGCCNFL